jgi:hypothetical protein
LDITPEDLRRATRRARQAKQQLDGGGLTALLSPRKPKIEVLLAR